MSRPTHGSWLPATQDALAALIAHDDAPITQAAADAALALLYEVMPDEGASPQIIPANAGGVRMEWHVGGVDLEVEVRADGAAGSILFEEHLCGHTWAESGPYPAEFLACVLRLLNDRSDEGYGLVRNPPQFSAGGVDIRRERDKM